MYVLPSGFESLEALVLMALFFLSALSGDLLFLAATLVLIAIFHPHRKDTRTGDFLI